MTLGTSIKLSTGARIHAVNIGRAVTIPKNDVVLILVKNGVETTLAHSRQFPRRVYSQRRASSGGTEPCRLRMS